MQMRTDELEQTWFLSSLNTSIRAEFCIQFLRPPQLEGYRMFYFRTPLKMREARLKVQQRVILISATE